MPRVSVVTPVFNRAELVGETIESVLGQSVGGNGGGGGIEHIVVDDGSTDGTAAVLAGFGDRIRMVRHDNAGEQASVNRGIGLASGDLVMIVNSDDPLLPGAVERLVAAFESRPELVVAYPDWREIDAAGRTVRDVVTGDFDLGATLCFHECAPGAGAMVRTSALRAVESADGFVRDPSLRYVADFDLWLRLGLLGPMRRVPEVLATWRGHAGGATAADRGRRMAREQVEVIRRFFERPGVPAELRALRRRSMSWARLAAAYHAGGDPVLRAAYVAGWAITDPANPVRWYRRKKSGRSAAGVGKLALRRMRGEVT